MYSKAFQIAVNANNNATEKNGPTIFNGSEIWTIAGASVHRTCFDAIIGMVAMNNQGAVILGTMPFMKTRSQPKLHNKMIAIIVTQINGSISCDSTNAVAGTRMSVCSLCLSQHDSIVVDRIRFEELPGVSDNSVGFTVRMADGEPDGL